MTDRRIIFLLMVLVLSACSKKKTELLWEQSLFQIGSQSSPRCTDLNGDGVLDVVMGAGKEEMAATTHGVVALDGQTGDLLWKQTAPAHVVGSPTFYDVNDDGTQDVFIGGRGFFLVGLDGKTGERIWTYQYQYENDPILRYARFNFYNSTFVPDQNDDGRTDLLTINGGNWGAAREDTINRFPAVLMVLDPVDGSILAFDTMPDGRESYMSPVAFIQPGDDDPYLVFGSGGETIGGSLFQAKLSDLFSTNLVNAKILVSESDHGYIAPPAIVDLDGDKYHDIIAVSHAGKVSAIDGKSQRVQWEKRFQGFEVSSSPVIGQFNGDDVPDILLMLSRGVWPNYSISAQVVLDGKNGKEIYHDSLGCFALSCAVVYDLDRDGIDEAIMSLNQYDCDFTLSEDTLSPPTIQTQLIAVDFDRSVVKVIEKKDRFRNIFSTPWIGDLDSDGYLDIVYSQYFNHRDIRKYRGMSVKRISTHLRCRKQPIWGAYMGSNGDGVYHRP